MAKSVRQMKVRRRPAILSHSVNSGCNLRCVFCDEWKKNTLPDGSISSSKDPSFEDICKIIDLAADFGIGSYNAWAAEPLLRKDLPEIMKYAKSKGLKTFMITNGILLKKRMNELIDVDYISVSVDGPTATREIRRTDYEAIIDGVRYASESGLLNQPLLINCVISAKNLNEVADLAHFSKELGNVKMAVEPIYLFQRMNETDWDDLIIGPAQREKFVSLMNQLIKMKKEGYPLINSKTYLKQIRDGKAIRNCRVDKSILAIDQLNNMYNCRIHNKPLGDVIENSVFGENNEIIKNGITGVWNKTKQERKEMIKNCEGCKFFGYAELTLMNNYNIESFYGYDWL
ncbi:MAG: radical SAM protein [Methanimicrococcus sp.]|nr:radical SAM protein [Methanimicrococcus sp.]